MRNMIALTKEIWNWTRIVFSSALHTLMDLDKSNKLVTVEVEQIWDWSEKGGE